MKTAALLLASTFACACSDFALPQPAEPPGLHISQLTREDQEVISAALIGAAAAEYHQPDVISELKVVTPDRTLRTCDPPDYKELECINPRDLGLAQNIVREAFGQVGLNAFRRRTRESNNVVGPIHGAEIIPLSDFAARQPQWPHHIFRFSNPAYLSAAEATVYVLHDHSAAVVVHLVRSAGWQVRTVRWLWIQ